MDKSNLPIGIFDSGIGGLTLARAIRTVLPNEDIIYFGDTAHLPYGDKSTAAIQAYSIKICNQLLQHDCKVITIACNSASASAYDLVKEYVGSRALVVNVIDPVVQHVAKNFKGKRVGIIGTKRTIQSNVYVDKIQAVAENTTVVTLSTPLLAPMVEEGFFNNKISENIIHEYLKHDELQNIDALVLGCTHYPLIKKQIDDYYEGKVAVIDYSEIVAGSLFGMLKMENLMNELPDQHTRCYVSDYTESFAESTEIFFGRKIQLEHFPLWE